MQELYIWHVAYMSCQTGSLHNQHKMGMVRHLSSRMSSMCVNWQKMRPPRVVWEQLLQNTTTCTCNNLIYNMILDQSHIRLTGDTNLIFGPLFLFSLSFSFLSSNSWFSFSIIVIRVLQRCWSSWKSHHKCTSTPLVPAHTHLTLYRPDGPLIGSPSLEAQGDRTGSPVPCTVWGDREPGRMWRERRG